MGAETDAFVWCDGPNDQDQCPVMNSEHGPTIKATRQFLAELEKPWVVKTRGGFKVDLCPECQKESA